MLEKYALLEGTSKDNSLASVYVWNQMSLEITKEQFDIDTLAPRKK